MKLENITRENYEEIKKLTQNENIMTYVGDGDIWDDVKISNFIEYNNPEKKSERKEKYFTIRDGKNFIGLIGISYLIVFGNYYFNIILDKKFHGKGYYHKSLKIFKQELEKYNMKYDKFYLLVRQENKRMLSISERYYFNRHIDLDDKKYSEYCMFNRDYIYLYLSSKEDNKIAKEIFDKRGNWRPYNQETDRGKLDFMFTDLDYKYDKRLFTLKSLLKNAVMKDNYNMTNKDLLYKELEKIPSARKYLVFNYSVDSSNIDYKKIEKLFEKYKVMIFKPVGGAAGLGIEVFDNFDKFRKYCEGNKSLKKYKDWVLQDYIINPLLIDGKKFHIRGYYLVHQNQKYLMDEGRIILAEEKYKQGNYENKKIHDTHTLGSEKYVKYYPKDLKNSKKIQKQLEHLFNSVGNVDQYFKCFSESKDCYQLFGFDVMITDDYQVKLIEINSGPGVPNLHIPFGKKLLENQVKIMVDTTFPSKNKVDEDSGFVRVY